MNSIQLYLNNQLADLSDDHPIALTFQINDLAEVKNQQGNTSNQFKLPLTQNNRAILGYADDLTLLNPSLTTQVPYSRLSAKIVQNGIEILPNAIAEISQVDNDTAAITVLSGNVDFFDALGGQIADMGDKTSQWSSYGANLPWQPFDHKWDLQNVAFSQRNTEKDGWIYPIVDYGLIDPVDFTLPIDVRNQRPGFFIKKAVDLLVQSTGYTATGSLLADPLYPLLIAQFSNGNWEHGINYQNQPDVKGASASNPLTTTHNNPHNPDINDPPRGYMRFDNIIKNKSGFFDGVTYTPNERIAVEVIVNIKQLYFYGRCTTDDPANLNINITVVNDTDRSGIDLATFNYNFSSGIDGHKADGSNKIGWKTFSNNAPLSFTAELDPSTGEAICITYEFVGLRDSTFTLYAGSTLQVSPQNSTVKFGQDVQCERILPDMSQKDFLKDTFQRFGIICQTDVYSKTINFASLKDIIANIPVANDWTAKCVDQGKQVNYKLGNYAQVNSMEYQTDPNILPLKFGWDQFIINDQTLSSVATDLVVSKFGASLNRPYIGGTIAQVVMIDNKSDSTDFSIGVQPRILVDQKLDLRQNNAAVTFIDGNSTPVTVNDIISVPYFYKPDGEYNLCWCDKPSADPAKQLPGLKTRYYADLQKILQNTRVLVRYFMLSPRDIAGLDLHVPVYLEQHGAYFYINKIDSWRKGQPCKVELVRLG